MLEPRPLTRHRVQLAYAIAVTADAVQWLLGPPGFLFADEILDVAAMVLISGTIGFHPLLLPTFALEFLPVVDLVPTWTACVALVVTLRKKEQAAAPPPDPGPFIDV
jgi:hypothetical protein